MYISTLVADEVKGVTMAMSGLAQLEAYASDLSAAVKNLANYCRNVENPGGFTAENVLQPLVLPEAPTEVHQARRSILANVAKLQLLLDEPADFLQQLAKQVFISSLSLSRMAMPTDMNCFRTSSSLVYNGWGISRCWPVYPSMAVFLAKM